ncbi:MAG: ABC transporter ATP-binding protein/permease [Synergistaceae bacterium]|nr:ABC transporter ATP-binding protein/permease [Synergistaceae bacterium]
MPAEKAPAVIRTMLRLWKYLSDYRWRITSAVLLTVLSNWLALLGPLLAGLAIDVIKPGAVDFRAVFWYCAWMTFFYAVSSAMNYFLVVQMVTVSQNTARKMRDDVFAKLLELPVNFFDNHQTGEIISHISYDIDTVNTSLSNDLLQISTSAVSVVGSLIMMLAISAPLASVFLVTVPIGGIFIKYKSAQIHAYFRRRAMKLAEMNGFVEEITSGQKTIKAYHQEETILSRFDECNEEAVTAYYDADYHSSILGPAVNFVNNISLTLISVFGAILYLLGYLSIGSISSFVLYSRKFSAPINEAANVISEIQSAAAAADRVFRLIDEASETPDAPDASDIGHVEGLVEMSHVRFGYSAERPVLRDLSFKAEAGSLTAIVGHTGAGKTTVINLLMRFYDPQSGTITIDGRDIKGFTRRSLRRAFAMVLQESWLFCGTVFENIAYGGKNATKEDVINAAKAAQAHGFIMNLPRGYETVLNEDGVNISKGQKQLITIARAMLSDAHMLILDEATSNVDTRTELKIQEAMRALMKEKTCFVIAHRLSTVRNADTILVMDGGDVAERGTHENLLELGGVYASLYRSQFG